VYGHESVGMKRRLRIAADHGHRVTQLSGGSTLRPPAVRGGRNRKEEAWEKSVENLLRAPWGYLRLQANVHSAIRSTAGAGWPELSGRVMRSFFFSRNRFSCGVRT
jgi:hypothetical protein